MAGLPFSSKNPALNDIYMNTAKGATLSSPDIRMTTSKGATMASDITMQTARVGTTIRGNQFKPWERELLDTPEVRRKATAAQLCESTSPTIDEDRLSRDVRTSNKVDLEASEPIAYCPSILPQQYSSRIIPFLHAPQNSQSTVLLGSHTKPIHRFPRLLLPATRIPRGAQR